MPAEESRNIYGKLIGCYRRLDRQGELVAQQHPPRFLKIVDDAKTRVRETNVVEVKS
jgi:hypothetical protein